MTDDRLPTREQNAEWEWGQSSVGPHPGVWHKDGPLAQIEHMADWAEGGRTGDGIEWETAGKIADNLRAAVEALRDA